MNLNNNNISPNKEGQSIIISMFNVGLSSTMVRYLYVGYIEFVYIVDSLHTWTIIPGGHEME